MQPQMAQSQITQSQISQSPNRKYTWVWLPLLLALIVYGFYLLVYVLYARSVLQFPFDYDQGEGFELYDAIRLARGQNIYLDNGAFPFYASNYPPVYRTLLVPIVWLFGPKLWPARAFTFACSLAIGVLIFIAARRQFRFTPAPHPLIASSPLLIAMASAIAGLAFFAANYVYHIAPLARAHLPMVMFALAGAVCLERAFAETTNDRPPTTSVRPSVVGRRSALFAFLGIFLLITAGFTKLQAIDGLAAGFGFLLLRRPKWFAVALPICAVVVGLIVVLLNALTNGQFWLNVVAANVNEYVIEDTWRIYGQWLQLQGVLIACGLAYVVWDIVRAIRARSTQPITLWSLYFLTGCAMGMLTGKWGAGPAYLIASIAVSCICAVGLAARLAARLMARSPRLASFSTTALAALIVAIIFIAQAPLNVHLPVTGRLFGPISRLIGVADHPSVYPPYPYYDVVGYTQLGHFLDPADIANGWDLVHTLQQVSGPVWSEEAMLTIWAGKDVVTNPTQLYNLSKNNALDTSQIDRKSVV